MEAATVSATSGNTPRTRALFLVPGVTLWLAWISIAVWAASCVLLWASAEWKWAHWIFDPAVVGMTLGLVALLWFAAIYFREDAAGESSHRLRSAIAGSVVLVFLLLVVDLLTIAGMRDALNELAEAGNGTAAANAAENSAKTFNFVKEILDTFKWVVITVVGFYFAAGATEAVGKNVEQAKTARATADVQVAEANRDTAKAELEATRLAPGPPP